MRMCVCVHVASGLTTLSLSNTELRRTQLGHDDERKITVVLRGAATFATYADWSLAVAGDSGVDSESDAKRDTKPPVNGRTDEICGAPALAFRSLTSLTLSGISDTPLNGLAYFTALTRLALRPAGLLRWLVVLVVGALLAQHWPGRPRRWNAAGAHA
jgi:hypothetical protein